MFQKRQVSLNVIVLVEVSETAEYEVLAHGSYNGSSRETAARRASSTRPRSSGGIWALVWPVLAVRPHVGIHKDRLCIYPSSRSVYAPF